MAAAYVEKGLPGCTLSSRTVRAAASVSAPYERADTAWAAVPA